LRKFQEENQLKRKFPVRNFRKFEYTSCGCPFSPEILEKLFCSPLKLSGYPNRIVLTWKEERGSPYGHSYGEKKVPNIIILYPREEERREFIAV